MRVGIKQMMRQPTEAWRILTRPEIKDFALKYADYSKNAPNLPEFMNSLSNELVKQSNSVVGGVFREATSVLKWMNPFAKR